MAAVVFVGGPADGQVGDLPLTQMSTRVPVVVRWGAWDPLSSLVSESDELYVDSGRRDVVGRRVFVVDGRP